MGSPGNKRWGKVRLGKKYGPNVIRYYPVCLWCRITFPAKRPDAQTCKPAHRVALHRYVAKHGAPPLFPFGVKPDDKPGPKGRKP